MSEVSVTGDVALFGDARPASSLWESSGLTSVGSDFAEYAKGMQAAAGPEQVDRAVLRSSRLSMHAKKLIELDLDAAAESRYRAAATFAANHGRDQLASHALTLLSYFFALRGYAEKALNVEATGHDRKLMSLLIVPAVPHSYLNALKV